jgi:hypothetical protein
VDRDVPANETTVVRMALTPPVDQDEEVARVLLRDLEDSATGVLPAGVLPSRLASGRRSGRCKTFMGGFPASRGRHCAETSPTRWRAVRCVSRPSGPPEFRNGMGKGLLAKTRSGRTLTQAGIGRVRELVA